MQLGKVILSEGVGVEATVRARVSIPKEDHEMIGRLSSALQRGEDFGLL